MLNRSIAYYGGLDADKNQRDYKKIYSAIIPSEIVIDHVNNTTKFINYIGGDAYTASLAHISQSGTTTTDKYVYLFRDHLGSILGIIDEAGTLLEQTHYGAWGKIEEFSNSQGDTEFTYASSLLGRGYTGHEHFVSVGLIHMNGRMYDANLGRFLSPDNYIQDPFNTQSFNRYGYVWNNPLKYMDPSGEWLHIVIGAAIGGIVNLATNWDNIDNFWEGLAAFGAGAGSGAMTAVWGPGGAALGGLLTGATNSIIAQTGNGVGLGGVNWGQVALGGAIGSATGVVGHYAGGAVASSGVITKIGAQNITSPLLRGAVGGGVTGAITGFGLGYVSHGIITGNWGADALKAGGQSAALGAGVGFVSGGVSGYAYAKANNLDPLTGRPVKYKLASNLGEMPTNIHQGKQGKHIEGHNNYTPGRSVLTSDPQNLLNDYNSGSFKTLRVHQNKVIVDFGKEIGQFYNLGNKVGSTNYGTIHYSSKGAHIIPANPNQY